MNDCSPETFDYLRLTTIPGLGPILIARLVEAFGSPAAVLSAGSLQLKGVRGIGGQRARSILEHRESSRQAAREELDRAGELGVTLLARGDPAFPPLLAQIPDAPVLLYIRGSLEAAEADKYCLAIVGSRACTQYGIEQTERFAGAVAATGITIVSGGARGIDTAAHRAALRSGGRTIVVLGCGLAHIYPDENGPLFDQVAAGRGAIISELPLGTAPSAENFPARNRMISGLALGTLVIEAGRGSGALITARVAVEEHGREVFALPGRVDSASSEGSNDLLRAGAAQFVSTPGDIIDALHSPARHLFGGTHEARYTTGGGSQAPAPGLSPQQAAILAALGDERTMDELNAATGVEIGTLRAELTMLELQRRVVRRGSRFAAAKAAEPNIF